MKHAQAWSVPLNASKARVYFMLWFWPWVRSQPAAWDVGWCRSGQYSVSIQTYHHTADRSSLHERTPPRHAHRSSTSGGWGGRPSTAPVTDPPPRDPTTQGPNVYLIPGKISDPPTDNGDAPPGRIYWFRRTLRLSLHRHGHLCRVMPTYYKQTKHPHWERPHGQKSRELLTLRTTMGCTIAELLVDLGAQP